MRGHGRLTSRPTSPAPYRSANSGVCCSLFGRNDVGWTNRGIRAQNPLTRAKTQVRVSNRKNTKATSRKFVTAGRFARSPSCVLPE